MKRFLIAVAIAAASALLTTGTAHAAPETPLTALKKQYVEGRGVKIKETSFIELDGESLGSSNRVTGVVGFGHKGVDSYDLTLRGASLLSENSSKIQIIHVKGATYLKAPGTPDMPAGWVRYSEAKVNFSTSQLINIFDPKVLKKAIAAAKVRKPGEYRGTLPLKELAGSEVGGTLGKAKVNYRIFFNGKKLITRVRSEMVLDFGVLGSMNSITDTQYYEWGRKVKIQAPPKDQVTDAKDLEGGESGDHPSEQPPPVFDMVPSN
ncbi:hypothetical protein ACIBH1_01885 [Nonomuraea sp. NPDC050663]|uniref:hypothetical protein n=1 Tax=Nonomuraea sp. NPDC050663 TaxID=3364370 RepID=UPI00379E9A3E